MLFLGDIKMLSVLAFIHPVMAEAVLGVVDWVGWFGAFP